MHFSIPDTKECKDDNGGSYLAYQLHINGWQHCMLRYSQFLSLHQQLTRELPTHTLPTFPSKRLLPLSPRQVEDRRSGLEKYIIALAQEPRVLQSVQFNGFLACAQHETFTGGGQVEEVPLHVHLMNGSRVILPATDAMQSHHVMQAVCRQVGLPEELSGYFALFLVRKHNGGLTLVKKLHNFECPYISQKSLRGSHRIVLRKNYWYWDASRACEDAVVAGGAGGAGLALVYGQVTAEVQLGWVVATTQHRHHLAALQARGCKMEYLEVARTLKYYGYAQFSPCVCDFPRPNTPALVAAGGGELNIRISCEDGTVKEGNFKVTRMRCWRISTHQTLDSDPSTPCSSTDAQNLSNPFQSLDNREPSNQQINRNSDQQTNSPTNSGSRGDSFIPISNNNSQSLHSSSSSGGSTTARSSGGYVIGGSVAGGCISHISSVDTSSSSKAKDNYVNGDNSTNGINDNITLKVAVVDRTCFVGSGGTSNKNTTTRTIKPINSPSSGEDGTTLELSFEYLLRAGELRWIRILSKQAVLMSLCLQSMVQQLLDCDDGEGGCVAKPPKTLPVSDVAINYTKRDGTTALVYTHQARQPQASSGGLAAFGELSLRRLTERLTELTAPLTELTTTTDSTDTDTQQSHEHLNHRQQHHHQHVIENSAFNNITDGQL